MNDHLRELIDESIDLELNVAELDRIFRRLNADDKDHGKKLRDYMETLGFSYPD